MKTTITAGNVTITVESEEAQPVQETRDEASQEAKQPDPIADLVDAVVKDMFKDLKNPFARSARFPAGIGFNPKTGKVNVFNSIEEMLSNMKENSRQRP